MTSPLYIISADGANVDQTLFKAPKVYNESGVQHPRDVFVKWTDASLAAINVYRVTPDTLPVNHVETGRSYARSGDRFVETITSTAKSVAALAADITLFKSQFQAALYTALIGVGASVTLTSTFDYVDGVIAASSLSAEEIEDARFVFTTAQTFHRGDVTPMPLSGLAASVLLDKCGVALGIGSPPGGWTTETIEQKTTAASAAIDLLFIAAAEGAS